MHFAQEPDALEGGEAHQDVGVVGAHGVVVSSIMNAWGGNLQISAAWGWSIKKLLSFRDNWMCACNCPQCGRYYSTRLCPVRAVKAMDAILFWFGVFALGLAVAWLVGWLLFR